MVLFRLWLPRRKEIAKGKADPLGRAERPLAEEMLCLLARQLPGRIVHMVGNAAYASGAFAGVPENVTVTLPPESERRAQSPSAAPDRPKDGARRGRPPKKGPRLPKGEQSRPTLPPNGSRQPSAATAKPSR